MAQKPTEGNVKINTAIDKDGFGDDFAGMGVEQNGESKEREYDKFVSSESRSLPWARSADTLFRSLHEDWPLWVGSLWLVWKNRQQNVQHHHRHQAQTPDLQSRDVSTSALSMLGRDSSTQSSIFDSLSSIPWSLIIDIVVVGSLLTFKKKREINHAHVSKASDPNEPEVAHTALPDNKRSVRRDETEESHNDSSKPDDSHTVDELRRLLRRSVVTEAGVVDAGLTLPPHKPEHFRLSQQPSTSSLMGLQPETTHPQQQKYIELLVHNVSHTDLVLSLGAPALSSPNIPKEQDDDDQRFCLCRPRFSAFDAYSQRVMDYLNNQSGPEEANGMISTNSLISFPLYERSEEPAERYRIKSEPTNDTVQIPTGFRIGNDNTICDHPTLKINTCELKDLRLRGRDAPRLQNLPSDHVMKINAVFFPLLATLMPLWKSKIKEKYSDAMPVKQVLILVSGVGTPRNYTHSLKGNSTQQCAAIMKLFLKTLYPELVVVHVHSETNIFRYDENITFVQRELLPRIQEYRDAHAKGLPYPDEISVEDQVANAANDRPFSTEWRKSFSVTLSFADGSPARTHAIQAALRSFRPTYFHFWQLKTFWHVMKVVERDIEVHSFEEMETQPPIETTQLHDKPLFEIVVEEMKAFRNEMIEILSDTSKNKNDINSFWLRKTHKPVLAVLAVQTKEGGVQLYRGTNMEVSMPTGSLCAERNVIGSALARNPALRRQDLKLIAVLAVPNPPQGTNAGVDTDGSTSRPLSRPISTVSLSSQLQMTSQHNTSTTETDTKKYLRPPLVPSRKSSLGNEEEWLQQDTSSTLIPRVGGAPIILKTPPIGPIPAGDLPSGLALDSQGDGSSASAPPTPARHISLYDKTRHKRRVIVRSETVRY
jgi:A distinct subfamily of CDD/CDA-like deaminases